MHSLILTSRICWPASLVLVSFLQLYQDAFTR